MIVSSLFKCYIPERQAVSQLSIAIVATETRSQNKPRELPRMGTQSTVAADRAV